MAFQGSEHKIAGPRGSRNPIDTPTVNTTAAARQSAAAREWVDPSPSDPVQPKGTQGAKARFSINEFKSQVHSHGGLYRPNFYRVLVRPGPKNNWAKGGGEFPEKMSFLCNSASLPGVQMLTSDYRRQGYGTFDRRPFGVQVTDIPLTFFVDNNGYVLDMFNRWMNAIVNYNQSGGEHSYSKTGQKLFEVAYREHYIAEVEIEQFNQLQHKVQVHTLHEAFPIQMGDITVAWSENDSFAVLPVQFTFRTYNLETIPAPKTTMTQAGIETAKSEGYPGYNPPKPAYEYPARAFPPKSTISYPAIDHSRNKPTLRRGENVAVHGLGANFHPR